MVSLVFLRQTLRCVLPVEVWRLAHEAAPTPGVLAFGQAHNVSFRMFPPGFSSRSDNKYTFKPAVLLLSSFDQVGVTRVPHR